MSDDRRPTLTKDDVAALRTADQFSIRINLTAQGVAEIECHKKVRAKRTVFGSTEQELMRSIRVEAPTTKAAWFSIYGTPGAMRAFALLARPGDRVSAHAYSNGNQYTDDAELFHDVCGLTLTRTDTRGRDKRILDSVTVADSICKQNSARAIRP